jgi:cytochrome c
MKYLLIFISAAVGIVTTTTEGFAQRQWSLQAAMRTAGRQLFNEHCASCHTPKRDSPVVLGPSLQGILGRPAGSVAGFPYSDALKKSGIVWSEDNLRKWIADAHQMVPNTLMPHASISDPAEQLYVVEYLKTLKAPATPAR